MARRKKSRTRRVYVKAKRRVMRRTSRGMTGKLVGMARATTTGAGAQLLVNSAGDFTGFTMLKQAAPVAGAITAYSAASGKWYEKVIPTIPFLLQLGFSMTQITSMIPGVSADNSF